MTWCCMLLVCCSIAEMFHKLGFYLLRQEHRSELVGSSFRISQMNRTELIDSFYVVYYGNVLPWSQLIHSCDTLYTRHLTRNRPAECYTVLSHKMRSELLKDLCNKGPERSIYSTVLLFL